VYDVFVCFCSLALYGRGLQEDEDEEEDEDVEVHRFPGLLFRPPPQLLRYTAALRSPHVSGDGGDYDDGGHDGSDYDDGDEGASDRRGELRLVSQIGTVLHASTRKDVRSSC